MPAGLGWTDGGNVRIDRRGSGGDTNRIRAHALELVGLQPDIIVTNGIQFGGCDGTIANCLPIMPGWNSTIRLYRPRADILDAKWTFPQALPVN
jgi:hypothetical protein